MSSRQGGRGCAADGPPSPVAHEKLQPRIHTDEHGSQFACYGLAVLLRELAEDVAIYSFSDDTERIPSRRGFALRDAIDISQPHSGTELGKAVAEVAGQYDRLIVITDEQAQDSVPAPTSAAYVINVASYKNGVGYGRWVHIDGWSEAVIDYIRSFESVDWIN